MAQQAGVGLSLERALDGTLNIVDVASGGAGTSKVRSIRYVECRSDNN